jgi:serine/threonine protein kinase
MIETGTFLQQRYRIDRQIGQGGMGAVYIAKDERFNSTVAIKETLCVADENFRKAIEREARLLNSLKHSALPRVSDHFEEQNGQFLVMEYIPGEDVAAMLESSGKPFEVDQVLKWAEQLLDALDYLHTQDMPVIHRDIKPQNLKINSRGEMILLDFGLAKGNPTDAGHLTAAKSIFGYSRNYASLEQIQGTGTDPRSDLYSLAATLYHMLTGQPPEDALTRAMSVLSKKADPLVPASTLNPAVPRGVAGVLQRALDLDAGERPATAADMSEMLRKSEDYAYLADAVTIASNLTDSRVFAQPTQIMPAVTHAGAGSKTDVATQVFEPTASLSLLTSVKPGESDTNAELAGNVRSGSRRRAVLAGVFSTVIVGVAIAGAVYVADPNAFADSGVAQDVPEATEPEKKTGFTDASVSSIDVDQPIDRAPEVSQPEPPAAAAAKPQVDRPSENVAKSRPSSAGKTKNPDGNDDVVDIVVDDPDIPAGGVVFSDRDENGKVRSVRINPKDPRAPDSKGYVIRGFNPFPPGFDFRALSPQQQRKLQQMMRERSKTHVKPPPPKPIPSP